MKKTLLIVALLMGASKGSFCQNHHVDTVQTLIYRFCPECRKKQNTLYDENGEISNLDDLLKLPKLSLDVDDDSHPKCLLMTFKYLETQGFRLITSNSETDLLPYSRVKNVLYFYFKKAF